LQPLDFQPFNLQIGGHLVWSNVLDTPDSDVAAPPHSNPRRNNLLSFRHAKTDIGLHAFWAQNKKVQFVVIFSNHAVPLISLFLWG
jgi:hypothetical protein